MIRDITCPYIGVSNVSEVECQYFTYGCKYVVLYVILGMKHVNKQWLTTVYIFEIDPIN